MTPRVTKRGSLMASSPPAQPADRRAVRPVVLLILDGVGCRESSPDNALSLANKPHWDQLFATCPHTRLDASELGVGLPRGQMGNSEVGHLNMGAGRVVYQEFTRIDQAIESGEFAANPVLQEAIAAASARDTAVHVLGLLSPGGVHSHERQIAAMVELAARGGASRILVHAFLDGRDTPPKSAAPSLKMIEEVCARVSTSVCSARVASIVGRYFAMDRDKRWERIARAYELLVDGQAAFTAPGALAALEAAYARGETDEFVHATAIVDRDGRTHRMSDADVVAMMNFRADRMREITRALSDPAFDAFARPRVPALAEIVCLTSYGQDLAYLPVAFPPQSVANGFGEYISRLGKRQLRIAETEKYAHVTYFFNGGIETPFAGEDRILIPSPKVATYDMKPEMSAVELTDELVAKIRDGKYDAVICNYANGDMVGHTGNLQAAIKAVEVLDTCIGRIVEAVRREGGEVLITSDHGNVEMMHDDSSGQAHTAHTLNLVPCVYIGRKAAIAPGGSLEDIAPTLLAMMGLPQPAEMTGHPLIRLV
ncbi:MAG TPA: 2,3-bisphosphoglycerate-independent phosphoglycerate mutase [Opitutaceae bacterium]|nr:2,3-bisphosphoglycerate-independent phosphoglycerate mutase [Opitutaceae bacterium]